MTKKGLLVILCGPSQFGKDYIISETSRMLKQDNLTTTQPTVYKIRKPRESDPDYIKCVENEKDIPIDPKDRLDYTIYGKQKVVYSRSEIEELLTQGNIIFIATGDPEFASTLKHQFYDNTLSVFIRGYAVGAEQMTETELKRRGLKTTDINTPDEEEIFSSMEERLEAIKSFKPKYEKFMQDEINGADYIYINYWTLFGGRWNTYFDNKEKDEKCGFKNIIEDIYNSMNKRGFTSWRDDYFSQMKDLHRERSPYNLNDEWFEYRAWKEDNSM